MRALPTPTPQPDPRGRHSLGVSSRPGGRSHTYLYSRSGGSRCGGQPSPIHVSDRRAGPIVGGSPASSLSGHYTTTPAKPRHHPREKTVPGSGSVSARDIQLYIEQGREEKHKIERAFQKNSIVYAKKSPRLPKVYQLSKKIHHLANAQYPFTSPKVPEHLPTLTAKVAPSSSSPDRKSPFTGETTAPFGLPPLPASPLLRRPTTLGTRPLEEKDEEFQAFATRLDLQPLIIDDCPSKTLKFYTYGYPLLLKNLLETDREKYADRRSRNPSLGPNPLQRGSEVGKRLVVSNMALEELDKGTTDCRFITELRDDTFDPRKWPWNIYRYQ